MAIVLRVPACQRGFLREPANFVTWTYRLFAVAGGIAKLELYNNLRKTLEVDEEGELHYPAGYVHLPKVDAEFVQQLCAEQLAELADGLHE